MRLREIQAVLRKHSGIAFTTKEQPLPAAQGGGARVLNISQVRRAIEDIARVPGFASACDTALKDPLFTYVDNLLVPTAEVQRASRLVGAVKQRAEHVMSTLDAIMKPTEELTISVKIPEALQAPKELAVMSDALVMAFQSAAHRVTGHGLTFAGVDRGSSWLEWICANVDVLKFIKGLIDIVHQHRLHALDVDKEKERFRILEQQRAQEEARARQEEARARQEEAKADIYERYAEILDAGMQRGLDAMVDELIARYPSPTADAHTHVVQAVVLLTDQMASGLEVHPPLLEAMSKPPSAALQDALVNFPDPARLATTITPAERQLVEGAGDDAGDGQDDAAPDEEPPANGGEAPG